MLEFVCLPWSEVCSARVTSLLLLLLLLEKADYNCIRHLPRHFPSIYPGISPGPRHLSMQVLRFPSEVFLATPHVHPVRRQSEEGLHSRRSTLPQKNTHRHRHARAHTHCVVRTTCRVLTTARHLAFGGAFCCGL